MASTRKFRNVHATRRVAFVVDDIVSVDPWTVRGVEVRGTGEALSGQTVSQPGLSPEIIRPVDPVPGPTPGRHRCR
jgi:pyridoxamine 5'-phosphate oxidase family protein